MTTTVPSRPAHPDDEYCPSDAFVATIDARIETAYEAVLAIDPMSSLATGLRALGLDDRAHLLASPEARVSDARGHREYGFDLLWRFGPSGKTANIAWRLRFDEHGMDRTTRSITIHGQASNHEAASRIPAAWPIVETIARTQANNPRGAIDECSDNPWQAEQPPSRELQSAAA